MAHPSTFADHPALRSLAGHRQHRVLDALKYRMLQPDLVQEFVAEYHRTLEDQRKTLVAERSKVERARARVTGRIELRRVCRRLHLLREWSLYEQDDEQVFA